MTSNGNHRTCNTWSIENRPRGRGDITVNTTGLSECATWDYYHGSHGLFTVKWPEVASTFTTEIIICFSFKRSVMKETPPTWCLTRMSADTPSHASITALKCLQGPAPDGNTCGLYSQSKSINQQGASPDKATEAGKRQTKLWSLKKHKKTPCIQGNTRTNTRMHAPEFNKTSFELTMGEGSLNEGVSKLEKQGQ